LVWVLAAEGRFELVGEAGEGYGLGRRLRLWRAEREVGFSFAEGFDARAVAADAVLEEVGRWRTWGLTGIRWDSEPYRTPKGRT
jgi:hypothetical protein